MGEQQLQAKVIRWLKGKGCVVIKLQASPGVPVGICDLVFFKEGFYGFAEIKASKSAKRQPLQQQWVEKLDDWSWAKFVHPDNFEDIKAELELML